ncbi:hypothetical protein HBDW_29700 [Herbaspirillum sp. DW155]|uniref:hypothetical protein n=1 Tax=Herbaspirillum sp. DW155 TaxID=3095609 RepID=UPI0030939C04|nr:hypothetical protein HBDW_29700 [Herbaspirillum sp. DW155]
MIFILISVGFGVAFASPFATEIGDQSEKCSSKMREENIEGYQLPKVGDGAIDLMEALRIIHENFLLVRMDFMNDEKIKSVFGPGELSEIDLHDPSVTAKKMLSTARIDLLEPIS